MEVSGKLINLADLPPDKEYPLDNLKVAAEKI
jgi:hypothetical protein